ncbi:MAG: 50S ribosomal protein L44e [Candidatus Aenigmatarchaeota archaeon]
MEVPKEQNKFCPNCGKHTKHKLRREKVGATNRRALAWTERQKRRNRTGYGNKGKFSKAPAGEKPTKKVDLRYKCTECGKEQIIGKGFRVKRFEISR